MLNLGIRILDIKTMLKIQNIKDLTSVKKGINALKFFSDDTIELIHLTLKPEDKIELHKNSLDVVFYVLEGRGELEVDNEKHHIEKGSCVEVKKDLNRSWENIGNLPLALMAIKKK